MCSDSVGDPLAALEAALEDASSPTRAHTLLPAAAALALLVGASVESSTSSPPLRPAAASQSPAEPAYGKARPEDVRGA